MRDASTMVKYIRLAREWKSNAVEWKIMFLALLWNVASYLRLKSDSKNRFHESLLVSQFYLALKFKLYIKNTMSMQTNFKGLIQNCFNDVG